MTVARSVGDVLDDHVTLEVECVDRMYLNLYVPKLVYPTGVVGFFKYHRGMPVVSGASVPTSLPPCPGLRGEPCRRYVPTRGAS